MFLRLKLHGKNITSFVIVTFIFAICILNVDHYGITWDEFENQKYSKAMLNLATNNDLVQILNHGDAHASSRGPLFLVFLNMIESFSLDQSLHNIYSIRHHTVFIFYYIGCMAFFLLSLKLTRSYLMGGIAFLMLILNPRIFAHAFFNTVDIPLFTFYIFFLGSAYYFLQNKNVLSLMLLAFFSGVVTSLRLSGEIAILATSFLIILTYWGDIRRIIKNLLLYNIFSFLFLFLLWPYLWESPIENLIHANFSLTNFLSVKFDVLFLGNMVTTHKLPFYYHFLWMLISIPTLYLGVIGISFFFNLKQIIVYKNKISERSDLSILILTLVIILVTFLSIAISQFAKYNDWRHFYYLYPLFVLQAVIGLSLFIKRFSRYKEIIVFLFLSQFLLTSFDIYKLHPFQYTYFNRVSKLVGEPQDNFPIDYWGASMRSGFQSLLKSETDEVITITGSPWVTFYSNFQALKSEQKRRFKITSLRDNPKYFLTHWTFRNHLPEVKVESSYTFSVDDMDIVKVYKLSYD